MDFVDRLMGHPMMRETLDRVRPVIASKDLIEFISKLPSDPKERQKARASRWRALTPAQRYDLNVHRRLTAILSVFERLDYASLFVRTFPIGSAAKKRVRRDFWVDYHFGYYTITLPSLVDLSLLLIATVYQLGLADRHCRYDVIREHGMLVGTSVPQKLAELAAVLKSITTRRNLHLHRGQLADIAEVGETEFLENLKMMTFVNEAGHPMVSAKWLSAAWREAMRSITPILDDERQKVVDAVLAVLNSTMPEYKSRSDALRKMLQLGSH